MAFSAIEKSCKSPAITQTWLGCSSWILSRRFPLRARMTTLWPSPMMYLVMASPIPVSASANGSGVCGNPTTFRRSGHNDSFGHHRCCEVCRGMNLAETSLSEWRGSAAVIPYAFSPPHLAESLHSQALVASSKRSTQSSSSHTQHVNGHNWYRYNWYCNCFLPFQIANKTRLHPSCGSFTRSLHICIRLRWWIPCSRLVLVAPGYARGTEL